MLIITPINEFPDPAVAEAAEALELVQVTDTTGRKDVIEELGYRAEDGTTVRYLREPELEIPVIVLDGPSAENLRQQLLQKIQNVDALGAAVAYESNASTEIKITLLRILSAHALETTTEPIIRAAGLAALDASPFVRIGVAQLLQYAHHVAIGDIVRDTIAKDEDPDVRDFAQSALARFDAAPTVQ